MGISDTLPSGWYRPKKPLSRAQIRKMQEAYTHADAVTARVKELEKDELIDADETLKSLDIL